MKSGSYIFPSSTAPSAPSILFLGERGPPEKTRFQEEFWVPAEREKQEDHILEVILCRNASLDPIALLKNVIDLYDGV